MSNQAKSRALIALAVTHDLDLTKSYAYGNTNADVPMLESVGNPRAINPQRRLAQIAQIHNWPILHWNARKYRRDQISTHTIPRVAP